MAEISYTQKSFLGGEWSPYFQGRTDHPKYVTALNVCRNGLPIEEGTWLRRPGSRLKAPTYQNKPGRLYPVEFTTNQPYDVEFTDGWVRFYNGHHLVGTTDGPLAVTSIDTSNPAIVTLTNPATWDTDDEISFAFDAAHPTGSLPLRQRTFLVTKTDTTHFTLRDGLTLANIDGSTLSITAGTVITASRVLRLASPYIDGNWANNRIVQNQDFGIVLNGAYPPQVITITPGTIAGTADATLVRLTMIDGPYLDPVVDSSGIGSVLNWTGGTIVGPPIANEQTGGSGWPKGTILAVKYTINGSTGALSPQYVFMSYIGGNITPGNQPGERYGLPPISGFNNVGADPIIQSTTGWAPVDPTSVGSQATGVFTITAGFQAWKAGQYYIVNNCVSIGTQAYQCILGNVGIEPGVSGGWATYWEAIDSGVAVTGIGETPVGFQTTDVGRIIRMLSAPPDYDPTVFYNTGCLVTFQGQTYVHTGEAWSHDSEQFDPNLDPNATAAVSPTSFTPTAWGVPAINTRVQSETQVSDPYYSSATLKPGWAPVLNATNWIWGTITSVVSSSVATVTLDAGSPPMLSPLSNFQINTWRMGAYSDTHGYPTCGSFYEGRFWFGGAIENRFDTSQTIGAQGAGFAGNNVLNMAPTLTTGDILAGRSNDGTVTDACGISYTLASRDKNDIFWFEPDHSGIVAGTFGGEWAIQASTLSDPITPTSIQAKRVTKYGCANIEPRRTGISLVFIQKFKRRIMEFLSDVFTGRYIAPHLNEAAKHLTTTGVAEIGYQEELAPIMWVRTGEGMTSTTSYETVVTGTSFLDPVYSSQLATLSNTNLTWGGDAPTAPILGVAIDMSAKTIWYYSPWYGGWDSGSLTGQNPSTGSGGYAYTTTGALFPAVTVMDTGVVQGQVTLIPASGFRYPIPTGFSAWGATTWDAANKAASVTLSNGNMTATGTHVHSPTQGVRATTSHTSGKFYFEVSIDTSDPGFTYDNCMVGFMNASSTFTHDLGDDAFSFGIGSLGGLKNITGGPVLPYHFIFNSSYPTQSYRCSMSTLGHSGGKYYFETTLDVLVAVNGQDIDIGISNHLQLLAGDDGGGGSHLGQAGSHSIVATNNGTVRFNNGTLGTPGSLVQGQVIGIAVDLDAQLFWVYNPTSTKWNNDVIANQNPALGIGGFSFSGMTYPAYAALGVNTWHSNKVTMTANFGATAFSNTIPVGFQPWGNAVTTIVPVVSFTPVGGGLIGATYRRVSAFTSEAPAFVGWHRHDLGHTRTLTSIAVGPTGDGTLDNLDMVTTDGSNYYVEGLTQIFDEDDVLDDGWFVDGGLVPDSAYADTFNAAYAAWSGSPTYAIGDYVNDTGVSYVAIAASNAIEPGVTTGWQTYWSVVTGVHFTGLNWLIGHTVTVMAFGLDLGDYVVASNGSTFVPYGSGTAPASFDYTVAGAGHYLFTAAYITANLLTVAGRNGGVPYGGKFMPCVVGYTYTSQGQLLRPATPETSGTRAGPAMGKKRRSHLFAGLFHNTIGIQVGTDFSNLLLPANFKDDGDVLTPPNQMYSGTWRDTLESDYSFDSMVTWQILRPYPASVVSLGAMVKTQDV